MDIKKRSRIAASIRKHTDALASREVEQPADAGRAGHSIASLAARLAVCRAEPAVAVSRCGAARELVLAVRCVARLARCVGQVNVCVPRISIGMYVYRSSLRSEVSAKCEYAAEKRSRLARCLCPGDVRGPQDQPPTSLGTYTCRSSLHKQVPAKCRYCP